MKCNHFNCYEVAVHFYLNPVSGVYVGACQKHKDAVIESMLFRKRKRKLYEQNQLDDYF